MNIYKWFKKYYQCLSNKTEELLSEIGNVFVSGLLWYCEANSTRGWTNVCQLFTRVLIDPQVLIYTINDHVRRYRILVYLQWLIFDKRQSMLLISQMWYQQYIYIIIHCIKHVGNWIEHRTSTCSNLEMYLHYMLISK